MDNMGWLLQWWKDNVSGDKKPVMQPPIARKIPPAAMPVETMPQMVKRVCIQQKLNAILSHQLYMTIHCESNFNPKAVNRNRDKHGKIMSTDFGICQINDFYQIGKGKPFPSPDYVLTHPEECVVWMCRQFKNGNAHLWECWKKQFAKKVVITPKA